MLVRLTLLALGASLAVAQSFPPVKDWKSVKITLQRTSCLGSCPAYAVEIRDGVVQYRGGYGTAIQGEHKGEITRLELQQLIDEFRRADYMNPRSQFGGKDVDSAVVIAVMDAPLHTISVSIDGAANSLKTYPDTDRFAPTTFLVLENSIDRLGHTAKWVVGNNETIPALRREGFKFRTPQDSSVIAWALVGDRARVREIVQMGAPLSDLISVWSTYPLVLAARNPDPEVVRLLIKAGASKGNKRAKQQALEIAREVGNREAVSLLELYLRR
jgi:hypothetical protein